MSKGLVRIVQIAVCLLLAACVQIPKPEARKERADTLARSHGWRSETLQTGAFNLEVFLPEKSIQGKSLTIFIEGDGLAWISKTQVSANPTPLNPIGLQLALSHPESNAVYIARPCQYVAEETKQCESRYWTDARFAPEVIQATNRAVDLLKQRFGNSRLVFVGYSGGGAVAALVAARRSDVDALITLAGNLDHQAWARYHRVAPLKASLSPADEIEALCGLRQWHYVGGKDLIIPPRLNRQFAEKFPPSCRPEIHEEPDFTHTCCWSTIWPQLWQGMRETIHRGVGRQ